jgi:FtsH-binding integral membrane protein
MDYSIIADWLTVLFLLWYGLKKFIPVLDRGKISYIGAVLAIGAAIFIALSLIAYTMTKQKSAVSKMDTAYWLFFEQSLRCM